MAVDKVTGLVGSRRAIARAIKELRESRGKLLNEVARDLMMAISKLSRLENAQGKPLHGDIRDLGRYFEVEGTPLAARLERWVKAAWRPGWWTNYDDGIIEKGLDARLASKADAAVVRMYALAIVPALLQIAGYIRAVFRDLEGRPESEADQLPAVRLCRQEVLRHREGLDPLKLIAVTHESSLRQLVGSPEITREQLGALAARSAGPNVTLRMLPFTASSPLELTCICSLSNTKT